MKKNYFIFLSITLFLFSCKKDIQKENLVLDQANEDAQNTVAANGTVYLASSSGYLYAFDAATGTIKWTYKNQKNFEYFEGVPCVKDSMIYVKKTIDNTYLHAINNNSGKTVWVKKIATFNTDASSPSVSKDNIIYVASGTKLMALKANDGTIVWSWNPRQGRNNSFSSPTVVNGALYVSDEYNIYKLNAANGAVKWSYPDNDILPYPTSPCVRGGLLFYTNGYRLVSLDTNGIKKWDLPLLYPTGSSQTFNNDIVYVQSVQSIFNGKKTSSLSAVNAATGQAIWQSDFVSDSINIYSRGSMFYRSNVIYMTLRDSLVAFNAQNGTKLWSCFTGVTSPEKSNYASSAEACGTNSIIYITGMDNKLYAINTASGEKIWSADYIDEGFDASPVIVSGSAAIHPTVSGMTQ